MFTLREVKKEDQERGKEVNTFLGGSYVFVNRETSYESFCELFYLFFNEEHVADLDGSSGYHSQMIYGFIDANSTLIPIYKNNSYYIVGENGNTFSNISYKGDMPIKE